MPYINLGRAAARAIRLVETAATPWGGMDWEEDVMTDQLDALAQSEGFADYAALYDAVEARTSGRWMYLHMPPCGCRHTQLQYLPADEYGQQRIRCLCGKLIEVRHND